MKKIKIKTWGGMSEWIDKKWIDKKECPRCGHKWNGVGNEGGHAACCGCTTCGYSSTVFPSVNYFKKFIKKIKYANERKNEINQTKT